MLGYVKSLVAVGLALGVVLGAGLWQRNRTQALDAAVRERNRLCSGIDEARRSSQIAAELGKRQAALDQAARDATRRLAEKGREGPQLVGLVVNAVSLSGMKMTGAFENGAKEGQRRLIRGKRLSLVATSYTFGLTGSYVGLVRFFQNMAAWDLYAKVEFLKIVPVPGENPEGTIGVELVISVYSIGD